MNIFGELERLAADLYPYRFVVTPILVLVALGIVALAIRLGLHRIAMRHRISSAVIGVAALAVVIPVGYYTLSPLWQRSHLDENSGLVTALNEDGERVLVNAPPSGDGEVDSTTPTAATTPQPAAAEPTVAATEPQGGEAPSGDTPGPAATPFAPAIAAAGTFQGADDFHFGEGNAFIIESAPGRFILRFEEFSVRNGPDLKVFLSTDPNGYSSDGLRLGNLKATDGAFEYEIPGGADIAAYRSAVIWCEQFSVLFATARFE